jgi:hypothetical protein
MDATREEKASVSPEQAGFSGAPGSEVRRMRVHMSQSITGPLRNWTRRQWIDATEWITRTDGSRFTPEGLRAEFERLHSLGNECFPIGTCDNFDPKTGCRGHPMEDPQNTEPRNLGPTAPAKED